MKDIKNQVRNILNSYTAMKKELSVLELELHRETPALSTDFIEGAVLARAEYGATFGSHVSDKTADIVVEHVDSQRGGKYYALAVLADNIRFELHRLEYYLSLLPKNQAMIIRWFYFDRFSWIEMSELIGRSESTVQRRKKNGMDKLISYYSILDNFNPDEIDTRTRVRFIGYVHEERFTNCLKKLERNGRTGVKAMLYIVSGCNELWNIGADAFLDFNTHEAKSDDTIIKTLSLGGTRLIRLAYHLVDGFDRENLISVISRYFPGLEHVHLELAVEAVKIALFSYDC